MDRNTNKQTKNKTVHLSLDLVRESLSLLSVWRVSWGLNRPEGKSLKFWRLVFFPESCCHHMLEVLSPWRNSARDQTCRPWRLMLCSFLPCRWRLSHSSICNPKLLSYNLKSLVDKRHRLDFLLNQTDHCIISETTSSYRMWRQDPWCFALKCWLNQILFLSLYDIFL